VFDVESEWFMKICTIYKNKKDFYYFTFTVTAWLPVFQEDRYCEAVIESLKYSQRCRGLHLLGYVIMPTHLHLIATYSNDAILFCLMQELGESITKEVVRLLEKDQRILFLKIFENAACNSSNSRYRLWKDNFRSVVLNSEKRFHEKMYYMHENPVRQGFVELPEHWKYSSARNWMLHDDGIIRIDKEILGITSASSVLLAADIGRQNNRLIKAPK